MRFVLLHTATVSDINNKERKISMKITRVSWHALAVVIMGWATLCMAQSSTNDATPTRLHEVTVTGTNALKEDALTGPNQQPEWTARRRWATTRVYVQPPWQIETEIGLDSTF